MTCNRCSVVSTEAAKAAGAPEVEATWAENRNHPRFCPICHGFLRADGGCTKCDGLSVSSDDKTVEDDDCCPICGGELQIVSTWGGRSTGRRCRQCGEQEQD